MPAKAKETLKAKADWSKKGRRDRSLHRQFGRATSSNLPSSSSASMPARPPPRPSSSLQPLPSGFRPLPSVPIEDPLGKQPQNENKNKTTDNTKKTRTLAARTVVSRAGRSCTTSPARNQARARGGRKLAPRTTSVDWKLTRSGPRKVWKSSRTACSRSQ